MRSLNTSICSITRICSYRNASYVNVQDISDNSVSGFMISFDSALVLSPSKHGAVDRTQDQS